MSCQELRAVPPDLEVVRLVEGHLDVNDLLYGDLLDAGGTDVLRENLKFLLKGDSRMTLNRVAQHLQVSQNTVSRWGRGEHCPQPEHLRALGQLLSLPPDLDLHATPLFLLDGPSTHGARVQRLHEQLSRLSPGRLRDLYPALEQLLREPR